MVTQPIGPATFRDESDAISAAYWNGPNGQRVRYSMAVMFDAIAQSAIYAIQAQAPSLAPADAFPYISADRGIVQGFQEGNPSFRARSIQWLDRWAYSGRPAGVLLAVRGWILPQLPQINLITDRSSWWSYAQGVDPMPAGAQTVTPATLTVKSQGTWNWDYSSVGAAAAGGRWARAWVVIYSTGVPWCSVESQTWGSGTWGDGGAWGFAQPPSTFIGLPALVATWKAQCSVYPAIIVSFDDTWYQSTSISAKLPDGTWGSWHKVVNNIAVASRDPASRFITGATT
jgi:hypothetical protein